MAEDLTSPAQAALAYIEQGWRVLPLHTVNENGCSCGKHNCRNIGKHPITWLARHGAHSASTDPEKVRNWWAKFPEANVGIATGEASGLAIIDVDPEDGGDGVLHQLQADHEPLPETLTTLSGGGGRHLWFAHPGQRVRNVHLGVGVHMRGDGGYVVAPPSVHESGRRYRFKDQDWQSKLPLPALPDWVINKANQPKRTGKSLPQTSPANPSSPPPELQNLSGDLLDRYKSRMNPEVYRMIRDDIQYDHHSSTSDRDYRVFLHLQHVGLEDVEIKKVFYTYPIGHSLPSRHTNDVEGYLNRSIQGSRPLQAILAYHLDPTYEILHEEHQQDRRRVRIPISRRCLKARLQARSKIDEQTFRKLLRFLDQIGVRQATSGSTARYDFRELSYFLERLEHEDVDELIDEYDIDL